MTKIRVLYMKTNVHLYLAQFFLECRIFGTKVVEKFETHILSFFFKKASQYEIMWKNVAERGRPQMIIWHIHIAC
jgi:hypothetical protein